MGGSGGAGRGLSPGILAGLGKTDALNFDTKQCVALTHGSCVSSKGCPNISLPLSGETAAYLQTKLDLFTSFLGKLNYAILDEL